MKKVNVQTWWRFVSQEKPHPTATQVAEALQLGPTGIWKYLRGERTVEWGLLMGLPQSDQARKLLQALGEGNSALAQEIESSRAMEEPSELAETLPVPDLSDTDELHRFFMTLYNLGRDARLWSWEEFEKMSPLETVKQLNGAGFQQWADAWWSLIRAMEKKDSGLEVESNQGVTRSLWMKQKLEGYRQGNHAVDDTSSGLSVSRPTLRPSNQDFNTERRETTKKRLDLYTQVVNLERTIRDSADLRVENFERICASGDAVASQNSAAYDNDKFPTIDLPLYKQIDQLLKSNHELLEDVAHKLSKELSRYVDLWDRYYAKSLPRNTPISEAPVRELFEELKLQRSILQAKVEGTGPLSEATRQALQKHARAVIDGPTFNNKIIHVQSFYEKSPGHSLYPITIADVYASGLQSALEASFEQNYHHELLSPQQRHQAFLLMETLFRQQYLQKMAQTHGEPNDFESTWETFAEELQHELVGFTSNESGDGG